MATFAIWSAVRPSAVPGTGFPCPFPCPVSVLGSTFLTRPDFVPRADSVFSSIDPQPRFRCPGRTVDNDPILDFIMDDTPCTPISPRWLSHMLSLIDRADLPQPLPDRWLQPVLLTAQAGDFHRWQPSIRLSPLSISHWLPQPVPRRLSPLILSPSPQPAPRMPQPGSRGSQPWPVPVVIPREAARRLTPPRGG